MSKETTGSEKESMFAENKETTKEYVSHPEADLETHETREEAGARSKEDREQAERLKEELGEGASVPDGFISEEDVSTYVEEHLPSYLKKEATLGKTYWALNKVIFSVLERLGRWHVEGKEHVVEKGPVLVVANHTRFFDESKVMLALGRVAKIVGADMHFSNPIKRFVMKQIGAIEVPGTLGKLSVQEKEAVLERAPRDAKGYYQKVVERDERPMDRKKLREFLEVTVAALANGEAVTLFPEGLWTYEGNVMREAYPGIEAIARRYKKITGKELQIQPMGIMDHGIAVGASFTLQKGETVHDAMKHVADLLPEEARGYYAQK